MKKEFIPYEQALALKELGFEEPCFGYYDNVFKIHLCSFETMSDRGFISAPLYQQAFRWFREKYGLRIRNYVFVNMSGGISEGFEIFKYAKVQFDKDTIDRVVALTYEEAELACLNKLIEIVKNK